MKPIQLLILPVLFLYACNSTRVNKARSLQAFQQIDSLLNADEYFKGRDAYLSVEDELTELHRYKAGARIDNLFNRLEVSNEKINKLFSDYASDLSDMDKYQLLRVKQMNHSKLFEYKDANETVNGMLEKYKSLIKQEDLQDYLNTNRIWAALAGQPAQQLAIKDNTILALERDKLGLQNLRLSVDSFHVNFIFDTGANFSTVTAGTAQKMNIQLMDTTTIDVGTITGKQVKARIGVCPVFHLGGITVKNAVFLVFPDEALAIPQADFQINGIIGFPVIEAMKEVQLTKKGEFIVPVKNTSYSRQNMALKFLNPVIDLDGESYTFDSGANSTILYNNYYNKHKDSIDAKFTETDISIGGAGGNITKKGFLVPFIVSIDNRVVQLDSVQLFKEKLKDDNNFSGNIGQDLIGKFEKMTINFESMFIRFD